MARPRGNPNPGTARLGKKLPYLVCAVCGEKKSATRFGKKANTPHVLATDPKKYEIRCKLCKKPVPANAGPDYVHAEPRSKKSATARATRKRREIDKKKAAPKKTVNEIRQQVRIDTRIKSMLYTSSKGCEKCGERDPRKLEYDHKDPADKSRKVSRLVTDGYSWSSNSLRAEIRKCRILCANCHRVHTIKQQGYYASDAVKQTLRDIGTQHGFKP